MSNGTFVYQAGLPDWTSANTRLQRVRAAHSLVPIGVDEFLIIGGHSAVRDAPTGAGVEEVELNLDVEQCVLGQDCEVVAALLHGVAEAQVARMPDGTIAISDGRSIQLLDINTGRATALDIAAHTLVATDVGVAVLGITDPTLPNNLNQTWEYGVLRSTNTGLELIEAPPAGGVAAALDGQHVLLASTGESTILDIAAGTWTTVPGLPSIGGNYATAFQVGHGFVLVHSYGERVAQLFSMAEESWTPIFVPSTSAYLVQPVPTPDGAVLLMSERSSREMQTQAFRLEDASWLAGPPGPPWGILNAMATLESGKVISVAGADRDFIHEGGGN